MTARVPVADLPSLAASIVQWIAGGIIDGRWAPGERLNEVHIADELGVSRAPIREALRTLGEQGMVTHVPRVGSVVNSFTPQTVEDVYNLRCVIERWYAEESVDRLTDEARHELPRLLGVLEGALERADYPSFYSTAWNVREVLYSCHPNALALDEIRRLRARLHNLPNVLRGVPEMATWARDQHEQLVKAALDGKSAVAADTIVEILSRARDVVKTAYQARLNSLAESDGISRPSAPTPARIAPGHAPGTDPYPTP